MIIRFDRPQTCSKPTAHDFAEGPDISLAAARHKLTQLDTLAARQRAVHIGMPTKPV